MIKNIYKANCTGLIKINPNIDINDKLINNRSLLKHIKGEHHYDYNNFNIHHCTRTCIIRTLRIDIYVNIIKSR